MTQATSNGGDGKRRVSRSEISWPKGQAPAGPPELPTVPHWPALEPAPPWTRVIYLASLLAVLAPLALSGGLGMAGMSSVLAVSALMPALIVAVGIWRAVQVIRDRWRLASPPMVRWHRLARTLALWLMSLGAIVLVLRLLATPITRAVLGGARTESGAEFFVVGMVLTLFAGLAPVGLLLFEFTRLSAFEQAAREQRP
jgi:hypothetical protein